MRVCVIGAGFAGLAAADALAGAGSEVIVLEAGERVGGRVWSERLSGGGIVERGGEFITAGYDATTELALRHGLGLCGMGIRYPDRELHPDPGLNREQVVTAAGEVATAASREPARAASELLKSVVAEPDIRELFASRLQSALAFPFEDLDARFLAKVPSLLDDLETQRVEGGNAGLADAIAASLTEEVRLGSKVEAVRLRESGVTIVVGGSELTADACVVAVPSSVVQEIEFDPPLPHALSAEISSIPMSSAAKLAVPLLEPMAPRAVMSVPHRFWAWVTGCDEVGGRVVGSWAGSAPVIDALEARSGDPGRWIERLRELWPGLVLDEGAAMLTVWDAGTWSRGAYSVLRNREIGPRNLGSPRLTLAGEYTAGEWSGTMEGAIRSGQRAAAEVLEPRAAT